MRKNVNAMDYASEIVKALPKGVLLTAKADGQVNPMTIGWGTIGIQWGRPIFVAFVRENRHTRSLLDKNPEFTVNVPLGGCDKEILAVCGTKSGRNMDKIAELKLTPVESELVSVPGFRELPLTLECRLLYRQAQEIAGIAEPWRSKYYPQDVPGDFPGSNRDYHIAYYGEIVNAYLAE